MIATPLLHVQCAQNTTLDTYEGPKSFCSFTLRGFTPTSLFDKNDSLAKISFSAGWLMETDLQNRDFRVPTEAESGFEFLKQNRGNPA